MEGLNHLKEELNKIKNDEPSFLGMDGGNIDANVWVCGIEFGSDLAKMEDYYQKYVLTYSKAGYEIPYREECPDTFLKSTYDRFLATMYLHCFESYQEKESIEVKEIEDVLKNRLYNKHSAIFKLNLYPLAKKDTSWDKNIEEKFGISKSEYYGSLFNNRIKFIHSLTKKFSRKKLIICTSPKGYENIFVETFFERSQNVNFSYVYLNIRDKEFKILEYDDSNKTVVIIPFLGRGNLGSYHEVISMAKYLSQKYTDHLPF